MVEGLGVEGLVFIGSRTLRPEDVHPETPRLHDHQVYSIGALIIRIGFWGPEYYTYNNEPPTRKAHEQPTSQEPPNWYRSLLRPL